MKFILTASLDCFPSDNALDSMRRQERIAIKRTLKESAQIYGIAPALYVYVCDKCGRRKTMACREEVDDLTKEKKLL